MTTDMRQCLHTLSPRHEKGPGEHLTKSRPNLVPTWATNAAVTRVSALIWTLMFTFMVMLALYTSALSCSAWIDSGRRGPCASLISWREGLRTAATLIPTPACGSLPPVELSEGRTP
jgi:hypothetical protein